ncbi:MAG TPA: cysteine peptidase family C39 domain-containing protein [Fimbriimonadaceae bacterium]|nr:cysteine peptidase family C39 domain-containing protein [Fimbriimonadaceae bacterium]
MKPVISRIAVGVGVLGVVAALVVSRMPRNTKPTPLTPLRSAQIERSQADARFNEPIAETTYRTFIEKYRSSPDPHIQDEVGAARIRLAYVTARPAQSGSPAKRLMHAGVQDPKEKGRYERARQILLEAAKDYKGAGRMTSDFGGVKDQALYQAAVCLNAEGRTAEYRAALVDFIKTEPLSPLVDAAHKRIVKLDGKDRPEIDALLQTAHDKQQKEVRFEMSVCGPKCIVKLLQILNAPNHRANSAIPSYQAIAKLCGTTDKGTSLQGLRKGLKELNLDYYGFEVGRADIPNVKTPAILYADNHYLVVEKIRDLALTVYDPMSERERTIDLSRLPADQCSAIMLLPEAPKLSAN